MLQKNEKVKVNVQKEGEKTDSGPTETVDRDEKKEVVFVLNDGRVKQVEVVTGIQDNNSIEILKGIAVGDEVVVAPYNAINRTLNDSMMVKVVPEDELFKADK